MGGSFTWGALATLLVVAMVTAKPVDDERTSVDLRMPMVQPDTPDTYLCYAMRMPKDPKYITGFIPHGNMSTAHHILLYGCSVPGRTEGVWNCGEMEAVTTDYGDTGPVCEEGTQIVYAWAMDAPALELPQGVGFKVGEETSLPWLVLQVHYKDVHLFIPPLNQKDNSGLTLQMTSTPQPKRAGVYLMWTMGEISPHSVTYMETACSYNSGVRLHPFAFRTHAHTHGKVVSGYRIRDGQWEEIGRESPQKPQMFYNITHPGMDIRKGDVLAARCTMKDDGDSSIMIGATQKDEMCNFYVMYYVDGNKLPAENQCYSEGPPSWDFSDFGTGLDMAGLPADISTVPDTKEAFVETFQKAEKVFDDQLENMDDEVLGMLAKERQLEDWLEERGMQGPWEERVQADDLMSMPRNWDDQQQYQAWPNYPRYPAEDRLGRNQQNEY